MARTDGLHLIEQPRVVASDVANLVSRVRIMVRIGKSTWHYGVWSIACYSRTCFYELWFVDGGTTSCGS